jgi:hypothetical protein
MIACGKSTLLRSGSTPSSDGTITVSMDAMWPLVAFNGVATPFKY